MSYRIEVANLEDITMAHIHLGGAADASSTGALALMVLLGVTGMAALVLRRRATISPRS